PDALAALGSDWQFDDFLLTTISPSELQARLLLQLSGSESESRVVTASGVEIDEATYTARLHGRVLDLTYTEFELLKFLAQHPGRVFSRQQLVSDVWGYDYFGGTRTVDVHVRRLRAKLGPEHEGIIETVRNVGYRLVAVAPTSD
ncbi:MAG TPA: response regulator transcription factor, partial [Candidatus Avipropionibacterium avicola]|nr:response regulator transcription factor [Candidatus Avipropionibacterium avicola]